MWWSEAPLGFSLGGLLCGCCLFCGRLGSLFESTLSALVGGTGVVFIFWPCPVMWRRVLRRHGMDACMI